MLSPFTVLPLYFRSNLLESAYLLFAQAYDIASGGSADWRSTPCIQCQTTRMLFVSRRSVPHIFVFRSSIDFLSDAARMPVLNADVLAEIMNHVPDKYTSKFLLVGSSVLYHHAILKLLHYVNIRCPDSRGHRWVFARP